MEDWVLNGIGWNSLELGQDLFNPTDVAGWPGHRNWINETTLTNRWNMINGYIWNFGDTGRAKLLNMAVNVTSNSDDPEIITDAFIEHFLPHSLDPSSRQAAIDTFKGDVPANYYENGVWNLNYPGADWQCTFLLFYLSNLPEFQLF